MHGAGDIAWSPPGMLRDYLFISYRPHEWGRTNAQRGDEIAVEVVVDGDVVRAVRFTERGCSISQVSASMMTSAAQGRTRHELRDPAHHFGAMLRGETVDADRLGDLRALGGVSRFPARVPCALMAWRALDAALAGG